ncbi:hypothetical protein WYY_07354 [Bacillus velezensis M27]|nr:hypothetical protein KSO_007275 [Bacillus amyloliquefaciens IT-45]AHC43012.1 hypothetical protein U722_13140 [Bacillus amyloliquefaciens LFB112]EKE48027.1 hypothetical protein WYY_07354 [Bacillus velezensis M27]ERK82364.1 hypothetical protein N786_15665 [Bacillus amyloliquefaciens UASWS BA1]
MIFPESAVKNKTFYSFVSLYNENGFVCAVYLTYHNCSSRNGQEG